MFELTKESFEYYLKKAEQLEQLPDDDDLKKKWKSGEISEDTAIRHLALMDNLESYLNEQ